MIKIIGIVIIALMSIVLLKDINREYSMFVTIAVVVMLFMIVGQDLIEIVNEITDLSLDFENTNSYISLLVKILGVTLLAQFTADLCRDCGESALASQTEIVSKIVILTMTMPLIKSVISIVSGLLK